MRNYVQVGAQLKCTCWCKRVIYTPMTKFCSHGSLIFLPSPTRHTESCSFIEHRWMPPKNCVAPSIAYYLAHQVTVNTSKCSQLCLCQPFSISVYGFLAISVSCFRWLLRACVCARHPISISLCLLSAHTQSYILCVFAAYCLAACVT